MSVSDPEGELHGTGGIGRGGSAFEFSGEPAAGGAKLRVGVLGPLSIQRGGVALRARPAGERTVLGLLVLAQGAPVSLSELVETLWGTEPPMSSAATVQTYISRLRKALGRSLADGRDRLSRDGSGYRLELAEPEVDLALFRRLLGEARVARGASDTTRACAAYDESLSLWYGEPFGGIDALREHPAVIHLMQERTAAILEYAEVASGKGRHGEVLPYLRTLVNREPLDESAHAHLMIALAGTGRQGEAISLYEALRLRLDQQLGVYPGLAVQDAHGRVLRQQIQPLAAEPAGGGSRAVSADAPAEQRAGVVVRIPVCQLPPSLTDFTGRTTESRTMTSVLTSDSGSVGMPIVVVSGPPGVGKTALSLHVAHTLRGLFPDGQLYIHMAGNSPSPRDPADALNELLRGLGVAGSSIPDSLDERIGLFRSATAGKKVLMTVDDVAAADQVRPLLPGTAGAAVIVTARARLGALAGAHHQHLEPLQPREATEMLSRIVGGERVAAESAASQMLISACGNLPLALRIVAAKLATRPSWPVIVVARAISEARNRLDELVIGDLAVRASITSSYEALEATERCTFRRLGLLETTDVAQWAVAALLGTGDAAEAVEALVDKSLLMPTGTDNTGEPRYGLHDLLRDYAVERLEDESAGDRAAALTRALKAWAELAASADHRLPRVPAIARPSLTGSGCLPAELVRRVTADPVGWFNAERLNLASATRQACELGQYVLAGRLAAHQATFQFFQARLDDAERLWRIVIAAAEAAGDDVAAARADLQFAPILAERGKNDEAIRILGRCLSVFESLDDEQALGVAMHCRAYCAEEQNQLYDAVDYAQRGLDIARRIGDDIIVMTTQRIMGITTTRLGDLDRGIHMCEEALTLARRVQEPYAEFEALQSLAQACSIARRYDSTIDLCRQGLEKLSDIGYPAGEGYMLGPLGDAYFAVGRYREAWQAFSKAQQIFQSGGLVRTNAISLLKLAITEQEMDWHRQAISRLEAALPIFRELRLLDYEEKVLAALKRSREAVGAGE